MGNLQSFCSGSEMVSPFLLLLLPPPIIAREVEGCTDGVDGERVGGESFEVEG